MNQRFQSVEINHVSEKYADDELYRAVCTIGPQFESELTRFGLCPEECFTEAIEILSLIADKGVDILPELENMYLRKYNEYRRFDRDVSEDEIRKAVGIVIGFVIMAIDSSHHPFYREILTEKLTITICNHKFAEWASVLERIFSLPLPDGWFDYFIEEEPDEDGTFILPKTLRTKRAQTYFKKAIEMGYMKYDKGKFKWIGTNDKGSTSELAYFCGKVYNYVHTISGNAGEDFPNESLNQLFGVKRLYDSLTQVYNAQKPQRWRSQIDALFE